jgi:hypothetical protein
MGRKLGSTPSPAVGLGAGFFRTPFFMAVMLG